MSNKYSWCSVAPEVKTAINPRVTSKEDKFGQQIFMVTIY